MIFKTETGSVYLYDEAMDTLNRMSIGEDSRTLRKDMQSIPVKEVWQKPEVGKDAIFILNIRDDGASTVRRTSKVVSVIEDD